MRARSTSPNEMTALDEQHLLGVATDGLLLRCVAEATRASKVARETLASERGCRHKRFCPGSLANGASPNSIMLWRLYASASEALHEQIAASVRRAVADGTLVGGERLPAASELAAVLQVNVNTVLRAYHALR